MHHKVRATLGKHKATRPGDRVLVAATGGQSSTSLLHILQQGCNTDTKRLLLPPKLQRRGLVFEWYLVTMDYGAGYYKNVYGGLLWSVYNGLLWDEYAGYYDSA